MALHKYNYFSRLLTRFSRNDGGNFAIMGALLLMPIIALVGSAYDFSQMSGYRKDMQIALDAAVLNSVHDIWSDSPTTIRKNVESFTNSVLDPAIEFEITNVLIDKEIGRLEVSASGNSQTYFVKLVGVTHLPFKILSSARKSKEYIEIALVLDVSSSMKNRRRLPTLIDAVKRFADVVLRDNDKNKNIVISLVPYGGTVHLGPSYSGWLHQPVQNWNGCFLPRPPYHKSAGDELRNSKHLLPVNDFTIWIKTNPWCPKSESRVRPFLTTPNTIHTAANEWVLSDGTGTDLGVAWGYRMLSPKWRGKFGGNNTYPRDIGKARKYMVVMTDGGITWQTNDYNNKVIYSKTTARQNFQFGCSAAKADGIAVYTVVFEEKKSWVHKDLRDCASSPGQFYDAKGKDLITVFENIAASISAVRLDR